MGPTGKRITAALMPWPCWSGATGFALSQSLTSTSDVRIVAQKLEDGRIEFGLEQDGERILPRVRYFPANAEVGRWLKSSAVTIEVEAAAQGPAPSAVTVNGRDENAEFFTLTAGNWLATMTSVEWCSMHFGGGLGYGSVGGLNGSSRNTSAITRTAVVASSGGTSWTDPIGCDGLWSIAFTPVN